jgi:hypothetical protein
MSAELPEQEYSRVRQHCQRCGEKYLLENLEDCAVCKNDICYTCGHWRNDPATKKDVYICELCLEYREGWWNEGKPKPDMSKVVVIGGPSIKKP